MSSIVFGYSREIYNSLLVPTLTHIAWNTIGVTAIILAPQYYTAF